jgi:DNA-directed RNA polymerase omega subunit
VNDTVDIVSLPVEFDEKKIDGRFRLVNIATQRAKELASGAEPKMKTRSRKITTISIEETVLNEIDFLIGDEAIKAKAEAKKLDFRRLLEESSRETQPEELSKLEQDLKIYMHEKGVEEAESSGEAFESEK